MFVVFVACWSEATLHPDTFTIHTGIARRRQRDHEIAMAPTCLAVYARLVELVPWCQGRGHGPQWGPSEALSRGPARPSTQQPEAPSSTLKPPVIFAPHQKSHYMSH